MKPKKPTWKDEVKAASKPGAKKCTRCGFYACRCEKGIRENRKSTKTLPYNALKCSINDFLPFMLPYPASRVVGSLIGQNCSIRSAINDKGAL